VCNLKKCPFSWIANIQQTLHTVIAGGENLECSERCLWNDHAASLISLIKTLIDRLIELNSRRIHCGIHWKKLLLHGRGEEAKRDTAGREDIIIGLKLPIGAEILNESGTACLPHGLPSKSNFVTGLAYPGATNCSLFLHSIA